MIARDPLRDTSSGWVPRAERRTLLRALRKAGKTGQATCVLIDETQVTVTRFWCEDCGRHHALVDFMSKPRATQPPSAQAVHDG